MKNILLLILFSFSSLLIAQEPKENDYYKIAKIAIPEGIVLEAGGIAKVDLLKIVDGG